jgi:hypothetical protein
MVNMITKLWFNNMYYLINNASTLKELKALGQMIAIKEKEQNNW